MIGHDCDPAKRLKEKNFAITSPLYQVIAKFLSQVSCIYITKTSDINNYSSKITDLIMINEKNFKNILANLQGITHHSLFQCF